MPQLCTNQDICHLLEQEGAFQTYESQEGRPAGLQKMLKVRHFTLRMIKWLRASQEAALLDHYSRTDSTIR